MSEVIDFAVLVCIHNGERFIERQLRSIDGQVRAPSLVEIHDWGSSDSSPSIVAQWIDSKVSETPVRFYRHAEAPGPCASFLASLADLLQRSQATHVLFCDQDDVWSHEKLARYEMLLSEQRCRAYDLIFSDVALIDANDKQLASSFYRRRFSPFRATVGIESQDIAWVNPSIGMTLCISRELGLLLAEHRNAPWPMHDWAAILLCRIYQKSSYFLPEVLGSYRQHASNHRGAPSLRSLRSPLARLQLRRQQVVELADWCSTLPAEPGLIARQIFETGRLRASMRLLLSRNLRVWYRLLVCITATIFARRVSNA